MQKELRRRRRSHKFLILLIVREICFLVGEEIKTGFKNDQEAYVWGKKTKTSNSLPEQ